MVKIKHIVLSNCIIYRLWIFGDGQYLSLVLSFEPVMPSEAPGQVLANIFRKGPDSKFGLVGHILSLWQLFNSDFIGQMQP